MGLCGTRWEEQNAAGLFRQGLVTLPITELVRLSRLPSFSASAGVLASYDLPGKRCG